MMQNAHKPKNTGITPHKKNIFSPPPPKYLGELLDIGEFL